MRPPNGEVQIVLMLNHIAGRLQRVPKTQMRRISGQDGSGGRRRGTIKHRAARTGAAIRKYGRGQNLEEFREAGNIVGRHGAADDRLILDPQSGRARRRRDIGRGWAGPPSKSGRLMMTLLKPAWATAAISSAASWGATAKSAESALIGTDTLISLGAIVQTAQSINPVVTSGELRDTRDCMPNRGKNHGIAPPGDRI